MKRVIVTGAQGFIGHNLCKALCEKGHTVIGVDNGAGGIRRTLPDEVVLHDVDICDAEAFGHACPEADAIFHTAALPRVQFSIEHPHETHKANVTGTLNVLEVARNAGARVIFSSSSSVYGDQDTMPLVETMTPRPKSPYALHKRISEEYCDLYTRIFDVPTVCLRYFNVYGPGQSANGTYALLIGKFFRFKDEGMSLTITGDGEQTRDFTHVRDIVEANIRAMESDKVGSGEAINVGAGRNVSVNRIAELVGGDVEHIPARLEPHDTRADNTKARELLGWEPKVLIEDGIGELQGNPDRYIELSMK